MSEELDPTWPPEVHAAMVRKLDAEARWYDAQAEGEIEDVLFDRISRKKQTLEWKEAKRLARLAAASDDRNHVYNFTKPVGDGTVAEAIAHLSRWSRRTPGVPITIVFSSPGGEVFAGFALFDFLLNLRKQGHFITTICRGMAASMAGILLQAGDKRVMGKESYLLIHEVAAGAIGKAFEVKDEAEFLDLMMERVYRIFAERSGGKTTTKALKKLVERKDYWCDSTEALKRGFVDEVE